MEYSISRLGLEYNIGRTNVSRPSYGLMGMPLATVQSSVYEMQMSIYHKSIKYSAERNTPKGGYM